MVTKSKAIDLGALQDSFTETKRELVKAKREMERAQATLSAAKKKHQDAQEELKNAAATVLE